MKVTNKMIAEYMIKNDVNSVWFAYKQLQTSGRNSGYLAPKRIKKVEKMIKELKHK